MAVSLNVTMQLNQRAVDEMLRSPNGMVGAGIRRLSLVAERRAKQNIVREGRIQTGEMLRTTQARPVERSGSGVTVTIVSPMPYAVFQERGTRYIPPAWFMRDALASLRISDLM